MSETEAQMGCTHCGDLTEEEVMARIERVTKKLQRIESMDESEMPDAKVHALTIEILETALERYFSMLDGE